jgi:hypothetical protein
MMDINEIRHLNVRTLIRKMEDAEGKTGDRKGGSTMLAAKLGKSTGHVAHFASEKPTKNIGDLIAREIELAFGLERGWMDWYHDDETALHSQSQPVRLDLEIVRKVGVALNLRYKKAGGYNLAERPEEFIRSYQLWFGMPDAYVNPEIFNLVIQHADLSPQGADEDGRSSEGAPTAGAPGGGVRASRRR